MVAHTRAPDLPMRYALLLVPLLLGITACRSTAPTAEICVVAEYPHRRDAYTQGLLYHQGRLFEGTGLYGRSVIAEVELESGRRLRERPLRRDYFGEGVTLWGDRLLQLTWKARVGLVYDVATLEQIGSFRLAGEGWGLTHDGERLILSDGSDRLSFLDPESYRLIGTLAVRDGGRAIDRLNELEYIDGEIYANIWHEERIARISPESGRVLGWLNLSPLRASGTDVLNGIAYDAERRRLFVTGKLWPRLYEIAIEGSERCPR